MARPGRTTWRRSLAQTFGMEWCPSVVSQLAMGQTTKSLMLVSCKGAPCKLSISIELARHLFRPTFLSATSHNTQDLEQTTSLQRSCRLQAGFLHCRADRCWAGPGREPAHLACQQLFLQEGHWWLAYQGHCQPVKQVILAASLNLCSAHCVGPARHCCPAASCRLCMVLGTQASQVRSTPASPYARITYAAL